MIIWVSEKKKKKTLILFQNEEDEVVEWRGRGADGAGLSTAEIKIHGTNVKRRVGDKAEWNQKSIWSRDW